jgi:putative SOS response-associated peptidase YedK
MTWGMIPFFARGVPPKYSTINASIEKLTEAATWRGPWNRGQRCLVPALGFYEWEVRPDGKTKQPYYISANDQPILAFAGLWDGSKRDDGTNVRYRQAQARLITSREDHASGVRRPNQAAVPVDRMPR